MPPQVEIIDFSPQYREWFKKLNYEWLMNYYSVGKTDELILSDPEKIIREGGHIFFAKYGEEIVGTCALVRYDQRWWELIKMAVTEKYQGLGAGKLLMLKTIETARAEYAEAVILETAEELIPAIRLYESVGFRRFTLEQPHHTYEREVFAMKLDLNTSDHKEN